MGYVTGYSINAVTILSKIKNSHSNETQLNASAVKTPTSAK
jgi:hypothetical protein